MGEFEEEDGGFGSQERIGVESDTLQYIPGNIQSMLLFDEDMNFLNQFNHHSAIQMQIDPLGPAALQLIFE